MTLIRTVLAEIRQRPTRLLLTGLAVIVAGFFAAATLLLGDTAKQALLAEGSSVPPGATLVVSGAGQAQGPLDPGLVKQIAASPGVTQVRAADGPGVSVALAGKPTDQDHWFIQPDPGSGPLSSTPVVRGALPTGAGQVAVSEKTASRKGVEVGSKLTVTGDKGRIAQVVVTGVIKSRLDFGGTLVGTQQMIDSVSDGSRVYKVYVATSAGAQDSVRAALAKIGPFKVENASDVAQKELKELSSGIDQMLLALSLFILIAVFAAAVVVSSTFRIVVAQRKRRTALMRCVGATRGQVLRSLLAEAGVSGLVAGVLGVAIALGVGSLVVELVKGPDFQIDGLAVSWWKMALVVVGATLMTVVAAVGPAVGGTKVPPVEALGAAKQADAGPGVRTVRVVAGVLLALVAAGLVAVSVVTATDDGGPLSLIAVIGSGMVGFLALLAIGPVLVPALARLVGMPVRAVGKVAGTVAVNNAVRVPRRTAATTAVLSLGVTLISAVLVILASSKASVAAGLDAKFPAAIEVRSVSEGPLKGGQVDKLKALPQAGAVATKSTVEGDVTFKGKTDKGWELSGIDLAGYQPARQMKFFSGGVDSLGAGKVAVAKGQADYLKINQGDSVTLQNGQRQLVVTVGAVVKGSDAIQGFVLTPSDMAKLAPGLAPSSVLLDPAKNVDAEKLRTAVVESLGADSSVKVVTFADQRAMFEKVMNQVTLVILGLVGMTVLVAVVGVAVTLSLSVVERTQESGLLRALGLPKAGLRAMLAWEAVLFGGLAAVIGVGLGVLYGVFGVRALGKQVSEVITVPFGQLVIVAVGMVVLALLAALIPARASAKAGPLKALAAD
ncbi:FtsX-like permease family protein [Pseudonocardiaceae bacterium YIM PH 21723]|nr:FtsX-like permease family protein [Pseudonocardiaceae bacterium YIM PH 21723]